MTPAQAQAQLNAALDATAEARAIRDEAVRQAIRDGVSMYAIAKELDLSPQAIRKIRDHANT
ncbi:hypothetical protein M3C81_000495 [Micrococcus luteus]|nr:hypothetical protein [Micrococcus luteus]